MNRRWRGLGGETLILLAGLILFQAAFGHPAPVGSTLAVKRDADQGGQLSEAGRLYNAAVETMANEFDERDGLWPRLRSSLVVSESTNEVDSGKRKARDSEQVELARKLIESHKRRLKFLEQFVAEKSR